MPAYLPKAERTQRADINPLYSIGIRAMYGMLYSSDAIR